MRTNDLVMGNNTGEHIQLSALINAQRSTLGSKLPSWVALKQAQEHSCTGQVKSKYIHMQQEYSKD